MFGVLLINMALTLGQPMVGETLPPPSLPSDGLPAPSTGTVALPGLSNPGARLASRPTDGSEAKVVTIAPVVIDAPLLPITPPTKTADAVIAEESTPADRWPLMRALQGTLYGSLLDDNRMYLSGWLEASMNVSTAKVSNAPLVWTDRANTPMLQQGWLRFGRSVVTSGTTDMTFGFQVDILSGSDYRFTLPRGLLNSQLLNSKGTPNIYGVDPIQEYVNAYAPTLFQGTEFRVGRVFTPWGVESNEAVSTPLVTRSYAFNWAPPFTHCGAVAYTTFSPVWSGVFMAANGNDVFFGDPSEELRFVGNIKWTQPGGGQNTVTLATSVGRGKFNAGAPFVTPTNPALASEPTGRNNINVFDMVWTHTFSPKLAYNMEAIYGYQTNVPGIANSTGYGTANWASVAQYLFYTVSPTVLATLRFEEFDDFQGQRTGFRGLYTATTLGLQYKPYKSLIIRPEVRYDYNNDSRPFEGKHDLLFAGADIILRF